MAYNHATYLLSNGTAPEFGEEVPVKTAQVGELTVVSNAVCGCDPFMWLDRAAKFTAPNGKHPIYVTT